LCQPTRSNRRFFYNNLPQGLCNSSRESSEEGEGKKQKQGEGKDRGERKKDFLVFSLPWSIQCSFLLKSLSLSSGVFFFALQITLEQHSRGKVGIIEQKNGDPCACARHPLRKSGKLEGQALNLEPSSWILAIAFSSIMPVWNEVSRDCKRIEASVSMEEC
jgi:hypothetical protein